VILRRIALFIAGNLIFFLTTLINSAKYYNVTHAFPQTQHIIDGVMMCIAIDHWFLVVSISVSTYLLTGRRAHRASMDGLVLLLLGGILWFVFCQWVWELQATPEFGLDLK